MKHYEFKLVIEEGTDEFWESIEDKTGCDEVKELLLAMLAEYGFYDDNSRLTLTKFLEK